MQRSLDGIAAPPLEAAPTASYVQGKVKKQKGKPLANFLAYTTAMACVYVISAPYLPSVLPTPTVPAVQVPLGTPTPLATATATVVKADVPAPTPQATPAPILGPNRLVIPEIGVDSPIADSSTEDGLKEGVWHPSYTSTPDKGSNTVLAAHRYMYTSGPRTFYYLDRVKLGDTFTVTWSGQVYTYQVYETKVVTDKAVDIANATSDSEVTLFTCTPLWSSTNRLVVRARRV